MKKKKYIYRKNYKAMYLTQKGMREHYEELYNISREEFSESIKRIGILSDSLDDIIRITNDEYAKELAELGKKRLHILTMAHNRKIFGNTTG